MEITAKEGSNILEFQRGIIENLTYISNLKCGLGRLRREKWREILKEENVKPHYHKKTCFVLEYTYTNCEKKYYTNLTYK